ncbi:MAG: hypothetical protein ACON4V_01830, partial [Parvibaculales bacterium]
MSQPPIIGGRGFSASSKGFSISHRSQMASSKFIILGAGKPFAGDKQLFLKDTDLGSSTLRWMLDAVGYLEPDVHFVGGYNHHLVKETNPNLTFCHNPKWQETGAAASLLTWFEANPDAANDMPF